MPAKTSPPRSASARSRSEVRPGKRPPAAPGSVPLSGPSATPASGRGQEQEQGQEHYWSLIQNMQEGFAHCRMLYEAGRAADFLYLETNRAFEEITGLKDVVGKRAKELVPDLSWSGVELLETYGRVARTGNPEKLDFYHRGLRKWLVISVYSPAPDQFVTVVRDRTATTRTEQALRESEQSFRSLFENATLGLYRTTPEGRILMANPALLQMLGYGSLDDLAVRNLEQGGYEPGYERSEFKSRIEKSEVVRGLEAAWKRKDGTTIFVRESARIVRDEKGQPLFYEGAVEDVTQRRKAEGALAAERNLLTTLIDSLPDNVFIKDAEGRIVLDNTAHQKLLGRQTLEEVKGKTDGDFFPAELADKYAQDERRIIASGRPRLNYEERTVDAQGRERWLLTTKVPIRQPDGTVTGIVGINNDITERKEAEEALRRNEKKFRTIFDSAADAIFILGPEGRFIEANLVACERLGYSREELRAMSPAEIDTPEHAAQVGGRIDQVRQTGAGVFETAMVARDGRVIPTEISARMIEYEGRPAMLSVARDITERVQARESLRESEERFRQVFEDGSIGMALVGPVGRFFKVNAAFRRMLGYTEEEMGRLTFLDITHPEHREADIKNVEALWAGRISQYRTYKRYLTKQGDIRWGSLSVTRLQGDRAAPRLTLAMIEDISERRKAEDELQQLALRQEAILAAIPDILMEVDSRKVYTWANWAGLEFFGPDVVGREASAYFEGEQDTYDRVGPLFTGALDQFYVESWQRRRDGEKRLLAWWCRPLRDTEGRVVGALSSARDITPQKQAEIALRQSEQKYRDLVENINDVIYTITPEGRVLYLSPAVERVLGYSPDELIDQNFLSFIIPEDLPAIQKALADIVEGLIYPSEYRLRKKDGGVCWVRTHSRRIVSDEASRDVITGVLVDITESREAEESLRVSEDKFRYIFDNSPLGKSITLPSGQVNVNRAFCEMLGYSEKELRHRDWRDLTHPDDVAASQDKVDELLSGKSHSFRLIKRYLRKDGGVIWADVSSSLRWDVQGRPLYFMTSVLDITERKRAEDSLRESETRLSGILNNLQDSYFRADLSGRLTLASPSAAKMYGYDSVEELIGLPAGALYADLQVRALMLEELRKSDRLNDFSGLAKRRDGSTFWVSMNVQLLRDEAGKVIGSEGMVRDISERRRTEEELERHRLHLEELVRERTAELEKARLSLERVLHSAGEGIFGMDAQGTITFINEAGARMLGWPVEELVGREAHPTFHRAENGGAGGPEDECPIDLTARTGVSRSAGSAIFRKRDGARLAVEFSSSPLGDKSGPSGAVIVFHDVTERRRAEDERAKHMDELERFNRAMIDREKRIIEIKEEVNHLCQELGREPKYPPVWK